MTTHTTTTIEDDGPVVVSVDFLAGASPFQVKITRHADGSVDIDILGGDYGEIAASLYVDAETVRDTFGLPSWEVWDDSGTRKTIAACDAEAAAQKYVDGGDYGCEPATRWIRVHVLEDGDEDPETHIVEIPAVPPLCLNDRWAHDLFDVVMGASGGGVQITEECTSCGVRRVTNTWATCPVDGSQGHRSERWEPAQPAPVDD